MYCSECGKKNADGARFCNQCGSKLEVNFTVENPLPSTSTAQPSISESAARQEAPAPTGKLRRSRGRKIAAAVLVALLVLAGLGFAFKDTVINFALRTFAPARTYYGYVEAVNAKELLAHTANIKDESDKYFKDNQIAVQNDIELKFGDMARDLMTAGLYAESLEGVELGWLNQADITATTAMNKSAVSGQYSITLNGVSIMSLDMVVSPYRGRLYLRIPEYEDTYYYIDAPEFYQLAQVLAYADPDAGKNCTQVIQNLLPKLAEILYNSIRTVDKTSKTISAGDISQKGTALSMDFTRGQYLDMAGQMLTELDNEVNQMEQTNYSELLSELIDDMKLELETKTRHAENLDQVLCTWTVTVDNAGHIIARELNVQDEDDTMNVYFRAPKKGSNIAIEVGASDGIYYGEFRGSGKMANRSYTGDLQLVINDDTMLEMQTDKFTVKDGKLDGTINLTVEPAFAEYTGEYPKIDGLSYRMTFSASNQQQVVDTEIIHGDDMVVTVRSSQGPAYERIDLTDPADSISIEDIRLNLDSLNAMVDRLSQAGVPNSMTAYLYVVLNALRYY